MKKSMNDDFIVKGGNESAPFKLTAYRGERAVLLAMNWKSKLPPADFVGFSIEFKEPGSDKFEAVKNRVGFDEKTGTDLSKYVSSLEAPFQKFRWVHFPHQSDKIGKFTYRVKPVFMNSNEKLSFGEAQTAEIVLGEETYPNLLNAAFTKGFVLSQAFADRYGDISNISEIIPDTPDEGLQFKSKYPKEEEALKWMGGEAVEAILGLLDEALADKSAKVYVVAFELNLPNMLDKLVQLGNRLSIIIDDSGKKDNAESAESQAAAILTKSSGKEVLRQHLASLQHNKMIIVQGKKVNAVVCGSTNFSWRGFYIQSNNAVIMRGKELVEPFVMAFENYSKSTTAKIFRDSYDTKLIKLPLGDIKAEVSFSPHSDTNALLDDIGKDIASARSSVFYSLAFLYESSGAVTDAIKQVTDNPNIFVYGISDKKTGGIGLQKPGFKTSDGNPPPVYPSELSLNIPEGFKKEFSGGNKVRMHHKFVVADFDTPEARVYTGSYNFSPTADTKNGENLLLIKDRKIAVSYMIEALRLFDHFHYRVSVKESKQNKTALRLSKPPKAGEKAWWDEYYTEAIKIKDRTMFCK